MTEISGTIKFEVAGNLTQLKPVCDAIDGLRGGDKRIPPGAELTRVTFRVKGDVTRCSVRWQVKSG
jgi:hypothetical protein